MSLINVGDFPIDPYVVDGVELADRLNRLKAAMYSGLSNPTRPPDITAGGTWVKFDAPSTYTLMLFDGVTDTAVAVGDVTSGALALPFSSATNYKTGDLIWDAATGTLQSAKHDIASGSAYNAGDWNANQNIAATFVKKAGDKMTGLLVGNVGANIASASTVNLSTATGNALHITGTTTINGFTMQAGQVVDLIFDSALTLTHHATNNNLPGAANVTVSAATRARYFYDGTTVYCLQLQTNSAAGGHAVGEIFDFAGTTAPVGAMALPTTQTNGSRTTYAKLFAAIGTTWGVGDGSTTFGLPWAAPDYALIQANGNVGTNTVGQNLSHSHGVSDPGHNHPVNTVVGSALGDNAALHVSRTEAGENPTNRISTTPVGTGIGIAAQGAAANLPAGARVLKCLQIA